MTLGAMACLITSHPFDSCLGRLRSLVHRPQMPCAQIVCRVEEGSCQPFVSNNSYEMVLKKPLDRVA